MALITLAAVPAVMISPIDAHLLASQVPARGAIGAPATIFPIFTNIAGSIALIGGAAWSAWTGWRRPQGPGWNRVAGTTLIAAGAFVVAGTHSFAQVRGSYAVQPIGEALGIVLMFAGYLAIEARAPQLHRSPRTAT
jgi:hypothetical protein